MNFIADDEILKAHTVTIEANRALLRLLKFETLQNCLFQYCNNFLQELSACCQETVIIIITDDY